MRLPFLAFLASVPNALARPYGLSNLTVSIPNGIIHGTIDNSSPDVHQFLGIPYAKPPVGALRWTAPQPAEPFGEIDAKELPPSCMQYLTNNPGLYINEVLEFNLGCRNGSTGPITEDCLTLSVWAPKATKKSKLPVLLFIYGGSFTTGGQNVPYQLPPQWVQRTQSHIVVSFNYRLNLFGFPNAAGLASEETQNFGLLDQRLAVEWVRDNIASFGGDPERIGLWGQSAGAISVGYYSFSYPEDPIVNTMIMDSGNEFLDIQTYDAAHSNFTFLASNFGCGDLQPAEELECMRKVDAFALEDFIHTYDDAATVPEIRFTPTIDDKTVFANFTERTLAGSIAKVPAILGSNAEDGVPFVQYKPTGINETLAYQSTLLYFFCPGWKAATNRLAAGVSVYRYQYSGNFTNVSPKGWMGAWHSAELPLVFGTHPLYRGNSTRLEYETSHAMQDAYLAFVTNSGNEIHMTTQQWPVYNQVAAGLVREFGANVPAQTVSVAGMENQCPGIYQP
ncbi:Alpha/Beta hydrolase protein [Pseudomassariella vexata]|uniref:Carboxylic ester hydrolase n=1 Tax=Pseudomassariella vexata TaxID=1141098 RepID=A0A1Y2DNP7_9PEZI|nr:Alpha/Beta hydrolase protein [Pseudomassariella vexata]ORY60870.1 Alpha/Beta hydrolase protein [Pseudomassariella vexata]